jgi:hypothetical protein
MTTTTRNDASGLVKLLASSRIPNGVTMASWQVKLPSFLDGEMRTHRQRSNSAASFRARTTASMIRDVLEDPFVRWHWSLNEPGMQGNTPASPEVADRNRERWLAARFPVVRVVQAMADDNLHKQDCNRLLQPWSWMQYVVTTRVSHIPHFESLRIEGGTEPHFFDIATEMRLLLVEHGPAIEREAHLPYVDDVDAARWSVRDAARASSTRCRRASLFRAGEREMSSMADDVRLGLEAESTDPLHATPFEHQVWCGIEGMQRNLAGNFAELDDDNMPLRDGTIQHRKLLAREYVRRAA